MFGLKKRLLADTVEKLIRAQEKLPVADCRRAVKLAGIIINPVVGQQLEFGLRLKNKSPSPAADRVYLAGSRDGSRVKGLAA